MQDASKRVRIGEINGDVFMARLTDKEYLLRRKFLQRLWDFDETQKFYALLTPNKQQSLHLYYVTSNYDLSDEAAIDYRSKRTKSDAFSSGKAFNELYRITVNAAMRVGLECDYSDLRIFAKKIPQLNKKLRDYYMQKLGATSSYSVHQLVAYSSSSYSRTFYLEYVYMN